MADSKAYIRCVGGMGGYGCAHAPNTCTASAEYQAKIIREAVTIDSCPFCGAPPVEVTHLSKSFKLPKAMEKIEKRVKCVAPGCPIREVPIAVSVWQNRKKV